MRAAGVAAFVLRETRGARGRLAFFTACVAVGVAAVVGVSGLAGGLDAGLRSRSRELLAADLVLDARRELPAEVEAFLQARDDLEVTRVREMATMVGRPDADGAVVKSTRAELKVVDGRYPFYGQVVLDPPLVFDEALGAEEVFCGPELLASLEVDVGATLLLGGAPFILAAVVEDEPDRLDFSLTLGPRVFLSAAGLERTDLVAFGTRVRHRTLLKLPGESGRAGLEALRGELRQEAGAPEWLRIETHEDAQPGVRDGLERFTSFLALVALLSLLLGGIGVAQVVRAWLAGCVEDVAVLRSLGLSSREVLWLYLLQVLLLALVGSLVGAVLGSGLPLLLTSLAPDLLPPEMIDPFQPLALLRGLALGVGVAGLFSLPALTAVWRVPPARVLRSEAAPLPAPALVRYGASLLLSLGVFGAAWIQARDLLVAASFTGGLAALAGLLFAGAWVLVRLAGRVSRERFGPYLVQGLTSLSRPGAGTVGAIVALGLGVLVVTCMGLVQARLESEFAGALPEEAPTVFLVDIQPDQWSGVEETLADEGAESVRSVPVVMARLAAIDGRDVEDIVVEREREDGRDGRVRWALTREQRLTWSSELPRSNELVAGEWWSDPRPEVSLEREFAERLRVGLGSTLTFDVQGVPFEFLVTSLRDVEWRSFGINFFLVIEPGVLEGAPHFRLATARLEEVEEDPLQNALVAAFPNVTLLRLRPILTKIAAFLERLALGIRGLAGFTILAGVAILAGAVSSTQVRRRKEAALWKTLGVSRAGVVALFSVEFALTGAVAGLLGGLGAYALSWGFLEYVVQVRPELFPGDLVFALLGSTALALLAGNAASWRALRAPAVESLRG